MEDKNLTRQAVAERFESIMRQLFLATLVVALTFWGIRGFPTDFFNTFDSGRRTTSGAKTPEPASNSTLEPEPTIQDPTAEPQSEPPAPTRQEQMQELLNDFEAEDKSTLYVYLKDIKTGDLATINPNKSVPSGSIYKLFVALRAYQLNEQGKFSFTQAAGSTGYSVGTCVIMMVRNSTNVCGEAVRAMLGAKALTMAMNKQGYKGVDYISHEAAHVSAADIGLLYSRLLKGSILNKAHRAEFLQSLKDQQWTFRIPEGIPRGANGKIDWGNKTGDVYDYANDSAIVWGEKSTYILVVLSNGWPSVFPEASYRIRHLSGEVYNFMNGTNYPLSY